MPAARRFRVDSRKVVHETIDGETILIQLDTGTYYSLLGTGAEIWRLASNGHSIAAIVAELQRRYAGAAAVEVAAEGLIEDLLAERLIELDPNKNGADGDGAPPVVGEIGELEFVPPVLERYTDMQYFLLLDPIHEADEADGWPNQPRGEVGDGEGAR